MKPKDWTASYSHRRCVDLKLKPRGRRRQQASLGQASAAASGHGRRATEVLRSAGCVVSCRMIGSRQEVQNTAGEPAPEAKLVSDQPIPPVGKPLWLAEACQALEMLRSFEMNTRTRVNQSVFIRVQAEEFVSLQLLGDHCPSISRLISLNLLQIP